jgi:hypothetical protein
LISHVEACCNKKEGPGGVSTAMLDCSFAALDVLESIMDTRFIANLGENLERPFDQPTSLCLYQTLVASLRLMGLLNEATLSGVFTVRGEPREFVVTDEGAETVLRKTRIYDPVQYLLTVMTLLSYTAVQVF